MARTAQYYREKAERFRELARESDDRTATTLIALAEDFEAEAQRLEPGGEPPLTTND